MSIQQDLRSKLQVHPAWREALQTPFHLPSPAEDVYGHKDSAHTKLPLRRKPITAFVKDQIKETATHIHHWIDLDAADKIPERNTEQTWVHAPVCLCRPFITSGVACLEKVMRDKEGNTNPDAHNHIAIVVFPFSTWFDDNYIFVSLRVCPYAWTNFRRTGRLDSCYYTSNRPYFHELPTMDWILGGESDTRIPPRINYWFLCDVLPRGNECLRCHSELVDDWDSEDLEKRLVVGCSSTAFSLTAIYPMWHPGTGFHFFLDDWVVRSGKINRNELTVLATTWEPLRPSKSEPPASPQPEPEEISTPMRIDSSPEP